MNLEKFVISQFSLYCTSRLICSDTMSAYVGFEGYQTKSGFIHKELCIYYDENDYDHFIFKKPEWEVSEKDMKSVRYCCTQLNGLKFNDGSVPYNEIETILKKIENHQIYTFSDIAVKTLKKYLPNCSKIKNIQDLGFEMPTILPFSNCFRAKHRPRYCAKAKAKEVKEFMRWVD